MRTLRLSLVGTVILVLLGGAGSAVTAQDASGPVYATGTGQCIEPPGRTVQDDGAVELHVFRNECTLTSSDPRLSGTGVYDVQQFCLKEEVGHVCMGWVTSEVVGPDGTWVGTAGYVEDPSRAELPSWGVAEGTGAYEGWTYWYHIPDLLAPDSPDYGILYEGPPPPWGETLPLTPAE
jgi:hypothetical protein